MSIQIRISYETDEELSAVIDRLKDLGLRVSTAPQSGRYKRAYLRERPVRRALTAVNSIPTIEGEFPIN